MDDISNIHLRSIAINLFKTILCMISIAVFAHFMNCVQALLPSFQKIENFLIPFKYNSFNYTCLPFEFQADFPVVLN